MSGFDRHIRLPGTINFRDLGGYETVDGAKIKTGHLYRSGHLSHVETSVRNNIAALNISLVCDFRIDDERQEHPNRYAVGHAPMVKHLPIWPVRTPGVDSTVARLLSGEVDSETALKDQTDGYREFIRDQSSQFAALFAAMLANENSSVLLHCSAGKDRTGIASALLLTALGVSRKTVRSDYLLSAEGYGARAQTQFYVDKYWAEHLEKGSSKSACTPEDLHALFAVQPEKIDAAFDEMTKVCGSVDRYIKDILGVDEDALTTLRARYTVAV